MARPKKPNDTVLVTDRSQSETLLGDENFVLRLYVTGTTPNSSRAVENLKRICEKHLKGRYDLKVIDLYQQPGLAKSHEILAAPTLVKLSPVPTRKLLGDLSNEQRVLDALGIIPK